MVTGTESPAQVPALGEPAPTEAQVSDGAQPPESGAPAVQTPEFLELIKKAGPDALLSVFDEEQIAEATRVKEILISQTQRTADKAKQTLAIQQEAKVRQQERRDEIATIESELKESPDPASKQTRRLRALERETHQQEVQEGIADAMTANTYWQYLPKVKVDNLNRVQGDLDSWIEMAFTELTAQAFEAGAAKERKAAAEKLKGQETLTEAYYRQKFEQDLLVLSGQIPPRTGAGAATAAGSDTQRLLDPRTPIEEVMKIRARQKAAGG